MTGGVSGEGYAHSMNTQGLQSCSFSCQLQYQPPHLYVYFQIRPCVALRKINVLNQPLDNRGGRFRPGIETSISSFQQQGTMWPDGAYSRPFLCVVKDKSRCRSAGEGAGQWAESPAKANVPTGQ